MSGTSTELWELSAVELIAGYRAQAFSPVEVVADIAKRIERLSPALGAFQTLCLERASDEATAAERALRAGQEVRALTGVPFAAKDVFDSAGVRTTYGSPMFTGNVPARDARAVAAARAQGGILIGKTQTHEFAWGLTSVNEAMGTARNPWDFELVAGGSSGGSAVALGAHLVPLALGSDTGGSIRVPSGFCGTTALKPTYGRISTDGMWPLAPSLDHAGPMARSPRELQLFFGALVGDPEGDRPAALNDLRIVLCPDLHLAPLDRAVEECYARTINVLAALGARIEERSLPGASKIVEAFIVIQAVETVQLHRKAGLFPFRAGHYGPDVRARLEAGSKWSSESYLAGIHAREKLRSAFFELLDDGAYLLTPISAVAAPTIASELTREISGVDFPAQVIPYTAPQDLLGLPSCAVRCGFDDAGRPIGMQFSAGPWRDWDLLALARGYYEATADVQDRWPLDEAIHASVEATGDTARPNALRPSDG